MAHKPKRRKKRRARNRKIRLGWLFWLSGVLALAYFGIREKPEVLDLFKSSPPPPNFTPTPYPTPIAPDITGAAPDLDALAVYMLELINVDRVAEGLEPVQWDAHAAEVGRLHAQEMAHAGYMSHWNLAGFGPDIRYGLSGGQAVVMENVYSYYSRYDDGSPVWEANWAARVREAQTALMNSPGHRANILTPEHTHVGVGMAYEPTSGEFRVAQEFTNHYLVMQTDTDDQVFSAHPGELINIKFELHPEVSQPLINLAFEPLPSPMSIPELNDTSTYTSPAEFVDQIPATLDWNGDYKLRMFLPGSAQSGYYHLRIWVTLNGENIPASDLVIMLVSDE